MQRVILLPKLPTKEHFFISRLVVFNETFADLSNSQDYCILLHEGIAGRNATDVASAYIKCVSLCEKEFIIFGRITVRGRTKTGRYLVHLFGVLTQFGDLNKLP